MSWAVYIFAAIVLILTIIAAAAGFYAGSQLNTNNLQNQVTLNNTNIQNARNASWVAGGVSVAAAIFTLFIFAAEMYYPTTTVVV